jgi:hypothetical protein
MSVDRFSKSDFETKVMGKLNIPFTVQFTQGEYRYRFPVKTRGVYITVSSSIDRSGFAQDTGENSIRAWLTDNMGSPLGSKVQKWVTRQNGWDTRVLGMLRSLYKMGMKIDKCPKCNKLQGVYIVKKDGANKGRIFTNCKVCQTGFNWILDK